jgi:hypothetical protein
LRHGASIATKWPRNAALQCTIDMIADLLMLYRWARDGWEVHP